MGLEIKKKWTNYLAMLSYFLGFSVLLLLNVAILTKRNVTPMTYSLLISLGVIVGIVALIVKRDHKSILGLIMSLLTVLTLFVIAVFSFMINSSP